MSRGTLLAAALAAFCLPSCDAGPARSETRGGSTAEAPAPLLLRLRDAARSVPHEGTRVYESHAFVDGGDLALSYTERVVDRGDGCFRLEPVDVRSNAVDPFVFLGLQRERQAFVQRYRDFRVVDLDLLLENYIVRDTGGVGEVAGRATVELEVEALSDGHRYELSVDEETGAVLAYAERLADGTEVASLRYSEFRPLEPGVTVDCFGNSIEEQPLGLREDHAESLGFDVWSPALLPDGYVATEAARVRDPRGFDWYKLTFSDGVETLFFLQRQPEAPGPSQAALGLPGGFRDDRVMVYDAGRFSIVQGTLASREVVAVGKVPADDLLRLLDSARP